MVYLFILLLCASSYALLSCLLPLSWKGILKILKNEADSDENLPEFTAQNASSAPAEKTALPTAAAKERLPPSPWRQTMRVRWIKPGEEITLKGTTISDGMFYVGEISRTQQAAQNPELINLALEVAPLGQFTMRQTGYWPSYDALSPSGRRAYLHWLSEGRRHKEADPGLVFLFFYGLERRVLTAPRPLCEEDLKEFALIAQELQQLRAIYCRRSPSFEGYATRLLEWMEDFHTATDTQTGQAFLQPFLPPETQPDEERRACWEKIWSEIQKTYPNPLARRLEMPWRLRLALGQISREGQKLSPPMALAWLRYHPDITLRTPALRCPALFDTLFMTLFHQAYPAGMKVRKARTPLRKLYAPASHALALHPHLETVFTDIPDILRLEADLKKLEEIASQACDQLDLYSRALSKDPKDPQTVDLLILLPIALWPEEMRQKLEEMAHTLRTKEVCAASFGQIFQTISAKAGKETALPKRLSLKQLGTFLDTLRKLQIGLAPFPEKSTLDLSENYGFFHYDFTQTPQESAASAFSPKFLLPFELGVSLALCEHHSLPDPVRHYLEQQLLPETLPLLERQKARAHLLSLSLSTSSKIFNRVKKTLPSLTLSTAEKNALIRLLIQQAKLQSLISINAVKFLEKLYGLLGLDPARLPADISRGTVESSAAASAESNAGQREIILDPEKIKRTAQESQSIIQTLDNIFNRPETEPEPPPAPQPAPLPEKTPDSAPKPTDTRPAFLPVLDSAHQALAEKLLRKISWEWPEIEALASELDLMAEGALEMINEAAFDLYEEAFIEDNGSYDLTPEILEIWEDFKAANGP